MANTEGCELPSEPKVRCDAGLADMSLEKLIDDAAENLPEGWSIRIEVENGCGEVITERPDGSTVMMADGESDICEQFRNARRLIRDEMEADRLMSANSVLTDQPAKTKNANPHDSK